MDLSLSTSTLLAVLLASIRAGVWLALCPPFSSRGAPSMVKALLSVAIVLPLAPRLATQIPVDVSTPVLVADAAEQAVIGAGLAFLTVLLFAAIQSAGNLIDLVGGFTVAFAMDPFSYQGNAVFGRLYNLIGTTLMFATDSHQLILRGFTQSYKALPINDAFSLKTLSQLLSTGMFQMFLATLQIAGPLIAVMFATDVALGLLTRAAPALNPLTLSFPAKILLTLSIAGSAMMLLPNAVAALTTKAVTAVLNLLTG